MKYFLIAIITLSSWTCAFACQCGQKKGIESVDIVLTGKVKLIELNDNKYTISFKVKKSIKGEHKKGDIVKFTTPAQSSACGYNFTKGNYAIYSSMNSNANSVRTCSQTEKLKLFKAKSYKAKATEVMKKGERSE